MSSIKKFILEQVAKRELSQEEAKTLLGELAAQKPREEEIAIVGMAGRFPMANNPEQFWQLLRDGVNCIRDYPEARRKDFEHILQNAYYTEFLIGDAIRPEDIPRAHARAGYLDEIDKFDAGFFGIPPAEATFMDPYQRVALEIAWEAMEDAGYGGQRLHGSNTGVYIGKEGTNYSLYRYCSVKDPMQLTGSWESIMASRIAYLFNFRGPCMVVDTACSAGLVSIHMAVQAIINGDCDQAIAGGINLSVTGEFNTRFQGGMKMDAVESEDGVIRTFDGRANGTVWGEGVAMVMLKPLSRALADRDHIHAVIKGSAINNDGASNGLTAPNAEAQEQVIVNAWHKARINPESLAYVEAHGTGTVLGDPIEFKGLTAAFRRFTDKKQFCAIGSLKTNMGHLVAASGVASLFKVVKSLQHREMAPTINFGKPNPYINFLSSPMYVNDSVRPWRSDGTPRRAALSSFGFSHTNCHMVVEEAPQKWELSAQKPAYCFTLAAHSKRVLLDYVTRLRAFAAGDGWNLADVCYTANIGRGHYPHRLAIIASNEQELRERLASGAATVENGTDGDFIHYSRHQIVSEKKRQLDDGDITERKKKNLSEEAAACLDAFLSGGENASDALRRLAQRYVQGADVPWERFYAGEPRNRVSLPTYPFLRTRVWADPKITRIVSFDNRLHPLVERLVSGSEKEHVFESTFSVGTHWVLSDHRIKGTCVVPGTTYLEMARVAASEARGWEQLELRDVFFLVPMVVNENESRRVRIVLKAAQADTLEFWIESASEAEPQEWLRHVEGRIGRIQSLSATPRAAIDIAGLKAKAHEAIENVQGESDTGVFQFGPHWDAVRSAWRIGDDALARLALPSALRQEIATFRLHPSVLDNAVNLTSQSTGSTFLPFTYKSFKIFAGFTEEMYSLIVPKAGKGSGETLSYDVILTDGAGTVLGEITDYVAKKVNGFAFGAPGEGADGEYLSVRWAPQPAGAAERPNGRLLLIGPEVQRGWEALIDGFRGEGVELIPVCLSEGTNAQGAALSLSPDERALSEFAASDALDGVDGIVFAAGPTDGGEFAAHRRTGVDALFRLTKALLGAKARLPWGLCVLTRHAYRVLDGDQVADPLGAASAALGTVIGMEYKNLRCRLVDADGQTGGLELAQRILAAPTGRQTAVRAGTGFVRELFPHRLEDRGAFAVREDGAYLVTGGLGGLGLATADYLASKGKVKVVLTGRSSIAPQEEWPRLAQAKDASSAKYTALLALSGKLAALDYIACDVADAAGVEAMLTKVRAAHGPLRGIFHLAGVAGDGFLLRKEFARFDAVLKPKLDGLRHLYAATAGDALDCFVLFSSITALTGGEGQGDYAAANAFMDAFAWQGAAAGRPVCAINWPSWKEIGMAADFKVDDSETPFMPLASDHAFARLDRILAHRLTQVLPSTINPDAIAPLLGGLPFALAPELQRRLAGSAAKQGGGSNADDIQVSIRGKSEEDLTETEVVLSKVYAAVLGLAEIDVFTNFQDMGGNSIIATHLLKLIDRQFPDTVDISDVFSYSSIDEMAAYIDEKRGMSKPAAGNDDRQLEDMLDRVLDGDEEIDSILDKI